MSNIQVAEVRSRLLWVKLPVHGLPSMQRRSRMGTADKRGKETNQTTATCHKRCASLLQHHPPRKACILLSCAAPDGAVSVLHFAEVTMCLHTIRGAEERCVQAIDPEVLAALPKEIRRELEIEMLQQSSRRGGKPARACSCWRQPQRGKA